MNLENGAAITDFDMDEIIKQFARSESANIAVRRQNATQITEPGHDYSRIEPFGVTESNNFEYEAVVEKDESC